MTQQPDDIGDLPDAQLPGPEDGPVVAPRQPDPLTPNDGDLDVGDTPPGGDVGDGERLRSTGPVRLEETR